MTKDKVTGGHEADSYARLISALRMFLSSAGHAVSTYSEFPEKKAPARNDIEMATFPASETTASGSAALGGEPPTV